MPFLLEDPITGDEIVISEGGGPANMALGVARAFLWSIFFDDRVGAIAHQDVTVR